MDWDRIVPTWSLQVLLDMGAGVRGRLGRAEALLRTDVVGWLIIFGGCLLRVRQFMARLSLGNDEAALLRSIVHAGFTGLTRPFPNHQSAPLLFLFIQKTSILILGNKDYVSEIFPLVAGCVSIFLFYRIARRHFGPAGYLAVLAFALSLWLVSYSANPKQYSSDVLSTVLLVSLADRAIAEEARGRDFWALGIAGVLAIWLSHPAVFIVPGVGLAILWETRYRRRRIPLIWLLGMAAGWATAFGVDYIVSLRNMAADAYLQKYWAAYFVPLPPWNHAAWFGNAYRSLLLVSADRADLFALLAWSLLLAVGAVSLLARKKSLALVLILPFVVCLIAAAWRKYPILDRLLLFLVPLVYLLMAEGLRCVYAWTSKWNRGAALVSSTVVLLIVLWPMVVSAKRNLFAPPHPWDMRPVVEHMLRNWKEGDTVFASGGGETFQYYAESFGLRPMQLVVNNSHRIARFYLYRRQLQAFAGRARVWVVFAHFEEQSFQHQRYAKYLNRIGEIEHSFQTGFARAYLVKFDP